MNIEQFYRTPGYQLLLPSKGRYNNHNTSLTNDLEILPFTTKDELYLTNPDSLLNGSALENVVKSCVKDFNDNPRNIPMIDVEAILLAAKYSTYGDDLNLVAICPECGSEVKFSLSISGLLSSIVYIEDELYVEVGGIKFYIKPLSLGSSTMIQLSEFNEASIIKNILDNNISLDQRSLLLKPAIGKMVDTAIDIICSGVYKIEMHESNTIIEIEDDIKKIISCLPANLTKEIRNKQKDISKYGLPKNTTVHCKECSHEWENQLSLDPSSFFE